MKLVVYSANYGDKDRLYPETFKSKDIEYVYFTDQEIQANDRTIVKEASKYDDPIKTAKWYKLHSHILFPDTPSLWLDANYGFSGNLSLLAFKGISLIPHYLSSPYEEVEYCIDSKRANNERALKLQAEQYRSEGLPVHAPVYKGGIVLRYPGEETGLFNKLWWGEICKWQLRDQLSLSYVIWKTQLQINNIENTYVKKRSNHKVRRIA